MEFILPVPANTAELGGNPLRIPSVPTLLDQDGFLFPSTCEVAQRADTDEFRTEMEAQISQAERWGLRPSHVDNHMVSVAGKPEFYQAYLGTARKFGTVLTRNKTIFLD